MDFSRRLVAIAVGICDLRLSIFNCLLLCAGFVVTLAIVCR